MLKFYKTIDGVTHELAALEKDCWISAVAPTEEEKNYLMQEVGVLPEFVKASLDEEESSHIDFDDEANQTLIIVDYPSAEESHYRNNPAVYHTAPWHRHYERIYRNDLSV